MARQTSDQSGGVEGGLATPGSAAAHGASPSAGLFDFGIVGLEYPAGCGGRVVYIDVGCACEWTGRMLRWEDDAWEIRRDTVCAPCADREYRERGEAAAARMRTCEHVWETRRLGRNVYETTCWRCGARRVDDSSD